MNLKRLSIALCAMILIFPAAAQPGDRQVVGADEHREARPGSPRPLGDVNIDHFVKDTQPTAVDPSDRLEMVWYIPREFWLTSVSQELGPDAAEVAELRESLKGYFLLGFVQADLSATGAADFYAAHEVANNFEVRVLNEAGRSRVLQRVPDERVPTDLQMLGQQAKLIMGQIAGQVGSNMQFFVYEDTAGGIVADPVRRGGLRIDTVGRANQQPTHYNIAFPLNALYVPRQCPNGEPADVSWKFCPWTGDRLDPIQVPE